MNTTSHEQTRRPVMLVVLDGWGWREDLANNAVLQARTPRFDRLWQSCPHAFLRTDGLEVGLPEGQFGNSEVGHLNIGAGRVMMQDLPRATAAVADGTLERAPAFRALVAALRASGGACHLPGLVSAGGVHAHLHHGAALAGLLAAAGIPVEAHAFTDGRDVPPGRAAADLDAFARALPPGARIASVSGRYYAMDRDQRWERVRRAYDAIAEASGPRFATAAEALAAAGASGVTDEFVEPCAIGDYQGIRPGDGVLAFNFRADRIREIMSALVDPGFEGFPRPRFTPPAAAAGLTHYGDALAPYLGALLPPHAMEHMLGEVVAEAGRRQLRMAETEKYPHVTYFMNGGRERQFANEDRIMVPSPKVATYDLQPEMSAPELTERAVQAIRSRLYDLIILNYANADMVGHTGDLAAAIRAVEAVDQGLGRIADAVRAAGGALLVTADHGNAELMRDPATGGPHTAHTTFPVPVLLQGGGNHLRPGRLADVAPTLLQLMGLRQPAAMTGRPLIGRDDDAPQSSVPTPPPTRG